MSVKLSEKVWRLPPVIQFIHARVSRSATSNTTLPVNAAPWRLTPAVRLVLIALADYANADGRAWPSETSIANMCGISRPTVNSILLDAEAAGLITITRQRMGNLQTASDYRFDVARIEALNAAPPVLKAKPRHKPPAVKSADTERRCQVQPPPLSGLPILAVISADTNHQDVRHPSDVQQPPPAPESAAPAEQADSLKLGPGAEGFFQKLKDQRPQEEAKARQQLPEWTGTYGAHHVTRVLGILTDEIWTPTTHRYLPKLVAYRLDNLAKEKPNGFLGCGCAECRDREADRAAEQEANAIVDRAMRVTKALALAESWLSCPAAREAFWTAVEDVLPAHRAEIMEAADHGDVRQVLRGLIPEAEALFAYRTKLDHDALQARLDAGNAKAVEAQRKAAVEREQDELDADEAEAYREDAERVERAERQAGMERARKELQEHTARRQAAEKAKAEEEAAAGEAKREADREQARKQLQAWDAAERERERLAAAEATPC